MKIESSQILKNNTNFGMALYMPKQGKIAKKIGNYCAQEAEKARPRLEELANDVDIYVTPRNFYNKASHKGFDIVVRPLRKNNFFKRLFSNSSENFYEEGKVSMFELQGGKHMAAILADKTAQLRCSLIKYNK